jgi:hypothetical protein
MAVFSKLVILLPPKREPLGSLLFRRESRSLKTQASQMLSAAGNLSCGGRRIILFSKGPTKPASSFLPIMQLSRSTGNRGFSGCELGRWRFIPL